LQTQRARRSFQRVHVPKNSCSQLATLRSARAYSTQLLEIAIKPFDYFARIGNKLALLIGHKEDSLAQIRCFGG